MNKIVKQIMFAFCLYAQVSKFPARRKFPLRKKEEDGTTNQRGSRKRSIPPLSNIRNVFSCNSLVKLGFIEVGRLSSFLICSIPLRTGAQSG